MPFNSDDVFRFIFRNLSLDNQVTISTTTDHSERVLDIRPYYSQDIISDLTEKTISSKIDNVQDADRLSGVQFDFTDNDQKHSNAFSFKKEIFSRPQDYEETFLASFISPDIIMNNLSDSIDNVIINKQKDTIIAALKEIDSDISDIALGNNGTVYADLGLNQLIPANLLGDGIISTLSWLASLCNTNLTTIFIDEIGSGVHCSSMNAMWKAVLKAAHEGNHDKQFFEKLSAYMGFAEHDIQIIPTGGKGDFGPKIQLLSNPNLPKKITRIGFVRDADEHPARSAFQSICPHLEKNRFPVPKTMSEVTEGDRKERCRNVR